MAVISDSLWKRRFSADPSIVGRKIMLNGRPQVVVGVLPPGFQFPRQSDVLRQGLGPKTEILQPLGYSKDDFEEITGDFNWTAVARMRPGVSRQKAIAYRMGLARGAAMSDFCLLVCDSPRTC